MPDFKDSLKYEFADLYQDAVTTRTEDSECPIYDSLEMICDNYVDFEEIGRGGMKHIFKVMDKRLNRYVALAKLPKEFPKAFYDSFIREARITALLEHPNIISVHDIGISEDRTPFFTMELKVGENLGTIIKQAASEGFKGDVSQHEILQSFIKVCDAVSYAHSKEVLHLDLKPDNIQLGNFGEVVVCDWGLGKIIGNEDNVDLDKALFNPDLLNGMTLADEIKGTPGYMAPEQIETNGEKTKQTDIYSLGAVLYTILTGKPPFRGEVDTVIKKTREGSLTPPCERELNWEVPSGLNAVVLKAMSLNPDSRYDSVEKLKGEVANYLSGRTTVAENAGPVKEALLFYQRNKVICLLVCFFLFSLTGFSLWFNLTLQEQNTLLVKEKAKAEESRLEAVVEKERANIALKRMHNERGLVRAYNNGRGEKINRIYQLTDILIYKNPIESLEEAEALLLSMEQKRSEYPWAMMQLGYIYFLKQDFHKALQYLEKSSNDFELTELNIWIMKNAKVGQLLNVGDLKALWDKMLLNKYRLPDVIKMFFLDCQLREPVDEHTDLLEYILRKINPKWLAGTFIYDHSSKTLKISGKDFVRLSLEPNKLSQTGGGPQDRVYMNIPIEVKSLDLSGTSIKHLWQLSELEFESLNISDTRVQDLSALKNFKKINTLILNKSQFDESQLALIPQGIKVIKN